MGRKKRVTPDKLAEKLKAIRTQLNLTSEQLIEKLNCPKVTLYRASITEFENGKREPPSLVLLAYARLANILVEVLIDDSLVLPNTIPSLEKISEI